MMMTYLLRRGPAFAAVLLIAPVAYAQESDDESAAPRRLSAGAKISMKIEPGLAVAMTSPQSNLTDAGLGATIKLLFGVSRYLHIGPSATFTMLPGSPEMDEAGRSWSFGAGARLMRPHDRGNSRLSAISPWADADALYVRTGALDRPGFALGAGVAVPLDDDRKFWFGPYARYSHIVQGEREGFDNRDAKIMTFGLSLEVGSGLEERRPRDVVAEVVEPLPEEVVETVPVPVTDRDGDGILDDVDSCPDVAGVAETQGCPPYEKVAVLPDKLELREKIAFKWDSAVIEDESLPALDEVVRALKDNPAFRIQVDGHSSSDGEPGHNRRLSKRRAVAVLDYLVAHGISTDRLVSNGLSSSMPAEDNDTAAGRVSNRRVEFVVFFIIEKGNTP